MENIAKNVANYLLQIKAIKLEPQNHFHIPKSEAISEIHLLK